MCAAHCTVHTAHCTHTHIAIYMHSTDCTVCTHTDPCQQLLLRADAKLGPIIFKPHLKHLNSEKAATFSLYSFLKIQIWFRPFLILNLVLHTACV